MEARFLTSTGTRFSKVGDPVEAQLIAPVVYEGSTLLPAGLMLRGEVSHVTKLGMGFKHLTAQLQYRFHTLYLADGTAIPTETHILAIDTAKENVDEHGRISGIRPTTNVSSSLSVYAWRLVWLEPVVAAPIWGVKFILARSPDPEIQFPRGTEFLLRLDRPIEVPGHNAPRVRMAGIGDTEAIAVRKAFDRMPGGRAVDANGRPSDLVNVVLVGSAEEVQKAFTAAGWSGADKRSARSIFRTYRAVVERVGYSKAPVNNMRLAGAAPSMVFQKSLNTFAKRHHGRVWKLGETTDGQSIWGMAATEDVSIHFSPKKLRFIHRSDPRIDHERAKVTSDLLFTECADRASLVPGPGQEQNYKETDGRIAIIQLSDCERPRTLGRFSEDKPAHWAKRTWTAFHQDLVRSNLLFLSYNTTKLVAFAHDYLKPGKKGHGPRREGVSAQQADLLANSHSTTAVAPTQPTAEPVRAENQ